MSIRARLFLPVLLLVAWISVFSLVRAEDLDTKRFDHAHGSVEREDRDGVIEPDEYRKVSENGAVTRRPCPYTCEDRGIPQEKCRAWPSHYEGECYVQDLRIASNVFDEKAPTQ